MRGDSERGVRGNSETYRILVILQKELLCCSEAGVGPGGGIMPVTIQVKTHQT